VVNKWLTFSKASLSDDEPKNWSFAKLSVPGMQRDGALRYVEGSAPRRVAPPSQQGSNEARTLLVGG
jgi:hypothetical protein